MTRCEVLGLKLSNFDSDEQVLRFMAQKLYDLGIVKDSFEEAIVSREATFSTGLNVGKFGVAIPHTETQHVNQSAIAVVTFAQPVQFKQMGDNAPTDVQLVCMLALKEAHTHLEMLQKLMELFQNEQLLEQIIQLDDSVENKANIHQILHKYAVI